MEFEEEHDDPDEEMEIPDHQQPHPHSPYHHPPTNSDPAFAHKPSSSSSWVRYRDCQKNHAVGIGGSAIDGCGEFLAAGEEGTLDALRCAACNCHRNFHRKETADSLAGAIIYQSPHLHHHHYGLPQYHQFSPYYRSGPPPSGYLQLTAGPSTERHLALPASGGQTSSREDVDDYVSNPGSGNGRSRSGSSKKRFRTKFTQEQRERMLGFAERLGWRIQKQDDVAVEQFCTETGVGRHVLKVWMHNNKNTLGKKP